MWPFSRSHTPESYDVVDEAEQELLDTSKVLQYGDFHLTGAVYPPPESPVWLEEGYSWECYRYPETNDCIPVLVAAVSAEKLFDVFMELIDCLSPVVDVVLETSHTNDPHQDMFCEEIDRPVLQSVLYDFEDLLLRDGCSGIAVHDEADSLEVQFDEHKMLIIFGRTHDQLMRFVHIFRSYGVIEKSMRFIAWEHHVHESSTEYHERFHELTVRLGAEDEF